MSSVTEVRCDGPLVVVWSVVELVVPRERSVSSTYKVQKNSWTVQTVVSRFEAQRIVILPHSPRYELIFYTMRSKMDSLLHNLTSL